MQVGAQRSVVRRGMTLFLLFLYIGGRLGGVRIDFLHCLSLHRFYLFDVLVLDRLIQDFGGRGLLLGAGNLRRATRNLDVDAFVDLDHYEPFFDPFDGAENPSDGDNPVSTLHRVDQLFVSLPLFLLRPHRQEVKMAMKPTTYMASSPMLFNLASS